VTGQVTQWEGSLRLPAERGHYHLRAVVVEYEIKPTDGTTIHALWPRHVVASRRQFAADGCAAGRTFPRHRDATLTYGRMRGDGDVSDVPTPVGQNDQHEQQSIREGRHDEEIGGRDLVDLIGEERPPALGRRALATRHVLRDRGFADVDAQLQA
jgi:hypothetical protein